MMNRSLLSIVEETSQKFDSKRRRPQYEVIEDFSSGSKAFQAKIIVSFFDHTLVGEGASMKKKSAQHLAAGKVLLKIMELDKWNLVFPQAKTPEEVREMINVEMEKYGKDSSAGENPVVKLHSLCKEANLADPIFEEVEALSNSFAMTCRVADKFNTRGEGSNKKGAKATAAEAMLEALNEVFEKALQNIPKSSSRTSKESSFDFITVDPQLSTKVNQTEVDKISEEIENCFSSKTVDRCKNAIEHKLYVVFTRMYGKRFQWYWHSHITKDMTKVLESVHAVDSQYSKLQPESVPREALLDSFFGIGGDIESARNDAAKNALEKLNLWLRFQVTVIDDRPQPSLPSSPMTDETSSGNTSENSSPMSKGKS